MGKKIRRGVTFGGVAMLLSMLFLPLIVNFATLGAEETPGGNPVQQAILWGIIAIITVTGFYLGYTGWGSAKDY